MGRNRLLLQLALPVLLGLGAGAATLCFYPQLGQGLGSALYSSGQEATSYSYAVARAAPSVVNI